MNEHGMEFTIDVSGSDVCFEAGIDLSTERVVLVDRYGNIAEFNQVPEQPKALTSNDSFIATRIMLHSGTALMSVLASLVKQGSTYGASDELVREETVEESEATEEMHLKIQARQARAESWQSCRSEADLRFLYFNK